MERKPDHSGDTEKSNQLPEEAPPEVAGEDDGKPDDARGQAGDSGGVPGNPGQATGNPDNAG